jgi:hypothetical protein
VWADPADVPPIEPLQSLGAATPLIRAPSLPGVEPPTWGTICMEL